MCLVSRRHGNGLVWFDIESNKSAHPWLLIVFGALYCLKCRLQWIFHYEWVSLVACGSFLGGWYGYVPLPVHLWKRAPTSASADDPITFYFMFVNLCTSPFDYLFFWSFVIPWRSALLLCYGPWVMISMMNCCVLSVSFIWLDSIFLHLGELYSSLRTGVLHPLFMLFLLLALLRLIQVPLVTLG